MNRTVRELRNDRQDAENRATPKVEQAIRKGIWRPLRKTSKIRE
jgi:hypothetical protein